MSKQKISKIFKYRVPIMMTLILLAIIICVCATYITTYNSKKVNPSQVFTNPQGECLSQEKFESFFEEFTIYRSVNKDPVFNDDGSIDTYGTMKFVVVSKKKKDGGLYGTSFKIKLAIGADWIKYSSNPSSQTTVTIAKNKEITINSIDKLFPQKGPLLFTKVKNPKLFAYVTYTAIIDGANVECYSYLTYDYKTYSVIPVAK